MAEADHTHAVRADRRDMDSRFVVLVLLRSCDALVELARHGKARWPSASDLRPLDAGKRPRAVPAGTGGLFRSADRDGGCPVGQRNSV